MPSFMLVGHSGCGKTSFCQALCGLPLTDKKTQAIEIVNAVLDTPGEYLENRRYNSALQVSAVDVDAVVLMQDCTDGQSLFAPNFASMFMGKPVIGVVSKTDIGCEKKRRDAERMLREAGCGRVVTVSSLTGDGTAIFLQALHQAVREQRREQRRLW